MYTPSFVEEMDMGCLKVVNVTPENGEKGMPPSPAQVILIDSTNGMVVSVLDGHYVNELRTGAVSGAAFDVLANKKCEKGALIGTGGHAATQLEAMLTVRDLDQVKVFDQDKDRLWAFVEKMNRQFGTTVVIITHNEAIAGMADQVIRLKDGQVSESLLNQRKIPAAELVL